MPIGDQHPPAVPASLSHCRGGDYLGEMDGAYDGLQIQGQGSL